VLNDIVGQDRAVACLRRVVERRYQSPLLLIGEEGVGRRASVVATIKELIAQKRGSNSPELMQVMQGVHPDVFLVTAPSDKEVGVDLIRESITKSMSHPTSAPYRFFILDGADRLTTAAANAILKTLEEPPEFSKFFLLAESHDRVIPTIRSRCGRLDFGKLSESFVFSKLSQFEKNPDKALVYTRMGEGSIGRSTRYWGSNRIVVRDRSVELLHQALQGDLPAVFGIVDELNKDLEFVLKTLIFAVHDLLTVSTDSRRLINLDLADDLIAMRKKLGADRLVRLWRGLRAVSVRYESTSVNLGFQLKAAFAAVFVNG
jgi:DNA polymerase III subunit delta'